MNHMTTKVESHQAQRASGINEHSSGGNEVQPALGDTWGNLCTHRIRLSYSHSNGQRNAKLFKSPTIHEQSVPFQIGSGGIMDVEDASVQTLGSPASDDLLLGYDPEEVVSLWDEIDNT